MRVLTALTVFAVIFPAELPDKSLFASLVLGARLRPSWTWLGVSAAFVVHVLIAVAAGGLLTLLPHRVVTAVVMTLFAFGAGWMLFGDRGARRGHEECPTADLASAGPDETIATGQPLTGLDGPADELQRPAPATRAMSGAHRQQSLDPAGASSASAAAGRQQAELAARVDRAEQAPQEGGANHAQPRPGLGFGRTFLTAFGVIFVGEWGDVTQIATANLAAKYGDPLSVGVGAAMALCAVAGLAVVVGRGLLRWISVRMMRRVAGTILAVLALISLAQLVRG